MDPVAATEASSVWRWRWLLVDFVHGYLFVDVCFVIDSIIVFLDGDLMGNWGQLDVEPMHRAASFFYSWHDKATGSKTDIFDFSQQCHLLGTSWENRHLYGVPNRQ